MAKNKCETCDYFWFDLIAKGCPLCHLKTIILKKDKLIEDQVKQIKRLEEENAQLKNNLNSVNPAYIFTDDEIVSQHTSVLPTIHPMFCKCDDCETERKKVYGKGKPTYMQMLKDQGITVVSPYFTGKAETTIYGEYNAEPNDGVKKTQFPAGHKIEFNLEQIPTSDGYHEGKCRCEKCAKKTPYSEQKHWECDACNPSFGACTAITVGDGKPTVGNNCNYDWKRSDLNEE